MRLNRRVPNGTHGGVRGRGYAALPTLLCGEAAGLAECSLRSMQNYGMMKKGDSRGGPQGGGSTGTCCYRRQCLDWRRCYYSAGCYDWK